jgi:hypothetical protein
MPSVAVVIHRKWPAPETFKYTWYGLNMQLLAHDHDLEFFDELSIRLGVAVYPRRHTFLFREGSRYFTQHCSPDFSDWNEV